MRALVVLAHPLSDSLCAHLARQTVEALRGKGATVDVLDLYAEAFQPSMTAEERRLHYVTPKLGPEIEALQQRLAEADCLVLVFPTWWFSLPAILKGWFDRVWLPQFAFEAATPIKPLLTGLKSCLVITTLGVPWWIDLVVMRQPVKRVLRTGIVFSCAPQAKFGMLSMYEAETADAARANAFVARIRAAVEKL